MVIDVTLSQTARTQLESLNYSSSYVLENNKLNVTKVPTLIIGVGGTGIAALTRIKHNYERDYHKSSHIHFLGIDTDSGAPGKETIRDELATTTLDTTNNEWFHLKGKIKTDMADHEYWDDITKGFAPVNSGIEPDDDGAGGYRIASRFLFFKNVDKLVQHLKLCLAKVLTGAEDSGLNIIFTTGIAGGTGSGASMDIAYLLRTILEVDYNRQAGRNYDIVSYLILPEINKRTRDLPWLTKNGYAYLKELDYFNLMKQNNEVFKQEYTDSYVYQGSHPPFDLTYLFSGYDENNIVVDNVLERACANIAESVLDSLVDPEQGQTFIQSAISNLNAHHKDNDKKRTDVENSRYVAFGHASFRLPTRELNHYLSSRLFNLFEQDGLFKNAPSDSAERREVFQNIHATPQQIVGQFVGEFPVNSQFPEKSNEWESQLKGNYSYENVVKHKTVDVYSLLMDRLLDSKGGSQAGLGVLNYLSKCKQESRDTLQSKASAVFEAMLVDPTKGPYYIAQIFGDTTVPGIYLTEGNSISRMLKDYLDEIKTLMAAHKDEIARQQLKLEQLSAEKPSSIPLIGRSKVDIVSDYIKTCIKCAEAQKYHLAYMALKVVVEEHLQDLELLYNNVYGPITHVLGKIRSISQDYMTNVLPIMKERDKADKTKEEGSLEEHTNVFSLLNFTQLIGSIEHNIIQKLKIDDLEVSFLAKVSAQRERLIKESDLDIKGFVHEFLDSQMIQPMNMDVLKLIKWASYVKLHKKPLASFDEANQEDIDHVGMDKFLREEILTVLENKSQAYVHLKAKSQTNDGVYSSMKELLLPMDMADLERFMPQPSSFNVQKVLRTDRLSAYTLTYGFPLYMLQELVAYEREYETDLKAQDSYAKSLHLVHTEKEQLSNLPSFIPKQERRQTHSLNRLEKQESEYRELFEKCLTHGLITVDDNKAHRLHIPEQAVLELKSGGDKPFLHFQKLYQSKPVLEALVKEKEQHLQEQEEAELRKGKMKSLYKLLATGLVKRVGSGAVYNYLWNNEEEELGNFYDERRYVEFAIFKALNRLPQEQQSSLLEDAKEHFEKLTRSDDSTDLKKLDDYQEEFCQHLETVERDIIKNQPDNQNELKPFYASLKEAIRNL